MMIKLLIVEDDKLLAESLERFFGKKYSVTLAYTYAEAEEAVVREAFDLALIDINLPDGEGNDLIPIVKSSPGSAQAVIMTAYPDVQAAVKSLKLGAYDYIHKPFDLEDMEHTVRRALEAKLTRQKLDALEYLEPENPLDKIIGSSQEIIQMKNLLRVAATSDTTVTITGETGTGKELAAEALHRLSQRAERPFIRINSCGFPDNLVESELFGYEQGAFTDARKAKKGLIEVAAGGTVFFDEIAEIPMQVQAKLLRFLEDKSFIKLGGVRETKVDVRVLAATNKNLEEMVEEGTFRKDLFYRLNVVNIHLPSLHERKEDIAEIAEYYLNYFLSKMSRRKFPLSDTDKLSLRNYRWPGNVRELRNIMERTALFGSLVPLECSAEPAKEEKTLINGEIMTLRDIEKQHITFAYSFFEMNKTKTADALGISRLTLRKKLEEYSLE
jgi:two-component system response regulator AtoC